MKVIKLVVLIVLSVCILSAGVMFAIYNTDRITLDFIFFKTPEASVGIWLVFSAIFGTLVGFFINGLTIWGLKTRLRSKSKRLEAANKRLEDAHSSSTELAQKPA